MCCCDRGGVVLLCLSGPCSSPSRTLPQPSTRVCGFKIPVSSDDFTMPSCCALVMRAAWVAAIAVCLAYVEDKHDGCG